MRGVPVGKELNREQVRFVCQEVHRILNLKLVKGQYIRTEALNALAKKMDMSDGQMRKIASGEVQGYRKWVVEWNKEQNTPKTHVNGTRYTPEQRREVAKAVADGVANGESFADISKRLGIPEGSLSYLAALGRATKAKFVPQLPKAARNGRAKREEDWGQNFKAYVEAEEEKARAELAEKHEAERDALDKQLTAKRKEVIDRLLDMYTKA